MSVELVTDIWVDQDQWRQWGGGSTSWWEKTKITGETSTSYYFRNNWPLFRNNWPLTR